MAVHERLWVRSVRISITVKSPVAKILMGSTSTRVRHRRVPRIGSLKIFYCKLCLRITKVFGKPISKVGTLILLIFDRDDGDLW